MLLAIASLPIVVGALFLRPAMLASWPPRYYLTVHTIIETLVVVVAFATFAVQWYAAAARLGDARARFLGSAFLAVGLLETAHLLTFPGMPGLFWLESSTERGIVYWLAARLWSVGALLSALAVPNDSDHPALRRGPLLALVAVGVAGLLAADHVWLSTRPLFFVEGGEGLTLLKKSLEVVVAVAALVGMALYGRMRDPDERSAGALSFALGLTVLSELCFTLYARANDSFNLFGHVYLLLSSYGVFHALFVDAVIRPHERLGAARHDLEASNAELQRLKQHVEGELAVTIRDLERSQEQREDLMRAVSHDLRTPLQIVLLRGEWMLGATAPGTKERRAAEAVVAAGRQMGSMIQDLVDAVHLESGTLQLASEPVALHSMVSGFLETAKGVLETDRVRVELDEDLPAVPADRQRLARIVQNLVGNALKYSAPGTPVAIRAWRSHAEVVVAVSDEGPGIPAEDVSRVFDRFYRGAQSGKAGGLGLGLYISRRILEAHGGRIWCESKRGEGSTFAFALPVDRPGSLE